MEKKERLSFIEGIKECLQNISFKGRSRRSEFWWYTLFFVCISTFFGCRKIIFPHYDTNSVIVWGLLIFFLIVSYYQLAVTVRRLHDIGKSGWWAGILAILLILSNIFCINGDEDTGALVNLLYIILLCVVVLGFCTMDSKKEENKYGKSPKYDSGYEKESEDFSDSLLGKVILGCGGCLMTIIPLVIPIIELTFVTKLLCDIDPNTTYTWYSGIWHGLFFVPNLIRSWFGNALFKAESYTTAYNIWWWIVVVWLGITILFGRR